MIAVCITLISCASGEIVQYPESPDFPSEWGSYDRPSTNRDECPDIPGLYTDVPEIYVIDSNSKRKLRGNDGSHYGLFETYLAENSVVSIPKLSETEKYIQLNMPRSAILQIRTVHPSGSKINIHQYSSEDGSFRCLDGFLVFKNKIYDGQIEGMNLNGQTQTKLNRAKDGALIVLESYGPFRSNKKNYQKQFSHRFYRFEPKVMAE